MNIKGYEVEFIEDGHIYLVDGVITPSVTQILKVKFGNKYQNVNESVLNAAAEKGTAVHEAIEQYCKNKVESTLAEVRNFKFLMEKYGFTVSANEVPILLFRNDKPVCAGRLDLVIERNGMTGLADIKRTATLDKEYLAYQLNIYRLAYMQCYDINIDFLAGIHLRDQKRKYVDIPINEEFTWQLIDEWEAQNDSRTIESDIESIFR